MKLVFLLLLFVSCSQTNEVKNFYPHLKWSDHFKNQEAIADKNFLQKNVSGMKISFSGKLKGHYLLSETMVDIDAEKASKIFRNKWQFYKSLYADQSLKESGCWGGINLDPGLLETKKQITMQFDLMTTERLIMGICSEDQNFYRNQTLLIYCKSINTFYELKYYYPKNEKPLKQPIAACF